MMSNLDNPPPSARAQGYWPDSKAIYRNFEDLQAHLNERVNMRLGDSETTLPALLAEQRMRFETDEVPEVISPPSDWNHSFLLHKWKFPGQPIPSTEEVLESLADYLNPPLVKDELLFLYDHCMKLCDVVNGRLQEELNVEKARINDFIQSNECILETHAFFRDPEFGDERLNIITRHFIKRRWQHLGLWEEFWGIPGRYYERSKDRDDFSQWSDQWRANLRELDEEAAIHFVSELVSQRESFLRGQHQVIAARKRLHADATPSEVWDFIVSRPWFLWEAEKAEEYIRFSRVSRPIREMFNSHEQKRGDLKNLHNRVFKMWKDRSSWAPEWAQPPVAEDTIPGWWWPHEEDSSEEEDLTILNNTEQLLHYATHSILEYTPTESEALNEMAPDETTPAKRREKRAVFDEDEEKKWTEGKEASNSAVEKYAEEARRHASPPPVTHCDAAENVQAVHYDSTQPKDAAILSWSTESESCTPQMDMDDNVSEYEIDYIEEPEVSSEYEIDFSAPSDEDPELMNEGEGLSETHDAGFSQEDGSENSDMSCNEEQVVFDMDTLDEPEEHCLDVSSSTSLPTQPSLQPASDSFDRLWNEEQEVPDNTRSDHSRETPSEDLISMPPPKKPILRSAEDEIAASLRLVYGYRKVKETQGFSSHSLCQPNTEATEEDTQLHSISMGKESEIEKTPDGLLFPKQIPAGPDYSLFSVTDPFYLKGFKPDDVNSDDYCGAQVNWDDDEDLVSPRSTISSKRRMVDTASYPAKEDEIQATPSHATDAQTDNAEGIAASQTLAVEYQPTQEAASEGIASQGDLSRETREGNDETLLCGGLGESISPETAPDSATKATVSSFGPMDAYEHQCPRDCTDDGHSDEMLDEEGPQSPSSIRPIDAELTENLENLITGRRSVDAEDPEGHLASGAQKSQTSLSNDVHMLDASHYDQQLANDSSHQQFRVPSCQPPSLPTREAPLSKNNTDDIVSSKPKVSGFVIPDRTLSQPGQLRSEEGPLRGIKRKKSTAFPSSSEDEDNSSSLSNFRDHIASPAKKRIMEDRMEVAAFVENRIPGLVELGALRRQAEAARAKSPLRQRLPAETLAESLGYEGDDEQLPKPQVSASRPKPPDAVEVKEKQLGPQLSMTAIENGRISKPDDKTKSQDYKTPIALGSFSVEGRKPLASPKATTENLAGTGRLSYAQVLMSSLPEPSQDSAVPVAIMEGSEIEIIPGVSRAEEAPEETISQAEEVETAPGNTTTQVETTQARRDSAGAGRSAALGPLWHGVKKSKAKKCSASGERSTQASETISQMNGLDGMLMMGPQLPTASEAIREGEEGFNELRAEPSDPPAKMKNPAEKPSALKPIARAGVKTKKESMGPLRRSTRAAAMKAMEKLALIEW